MVPISYLDFSGGIADSYLSAPPSSYHQADNLLIDENGKLYTRYGIKAFATAVPSSNERLTGIYADSAPLNYITVVANNEVLWTNGTSWTAITGPAGNVALPNKAAADFESCVSWKGQFIMAADSGTTPPVRIYCTSTSPQTFAAVQLGLPALASTPTGSGTGTGTTYTYGYALHYYLQITDSDGTVFEENGPVTYIEVTSVQAPNAASITISGIPALANTSSTNYDVSTNLKIRIYRTQGNGISYTLLTTINNGTTSYVDSTADTAIAAAEAIYTNGDVLDYTPPPVASRYVTEANDFFWYASSRKLIHSNQGNPGACPSEFEDTIPQRIRGLSNIISYPILFCDRSVYRIEGFFDETGDGGWSLNEISRTAGCLSNRSIVPIPDGLVWAGNGGFYFTNGNSVQKISNNLNRRFQTMKSSSMVGTYDARRNLVYWTISSGNNSHLSPTDQLLILHLNYGLSSMSKFTTASSYNNIFPTTLFYTDCDDIDEEYQGCVLIGERRGYFLYENENTYTDPKIQYSLSPGSFKRKAIVWTFDTIAFDLGSDAFRKNTPRLKAVFENETDIAVQFYTREDDGGDWASLSEIRSDGAIIWDVTEVAWDDTTTDEFEHGWDSQPVIEGVRDVPFDEQNAQRRQFRMTNASVWLARSDISGTASINAVNIPIQVTLDDSTKIWPQECEDYEIYFETDSYTQKYTITNRVSDMVIEIIDSTGLLAAAAAVKWQIKGIRKEERCRLLSFSIDADAEDSMTPNFGTTSYTNA